jgi:hypothetical protein
MSCRAIEHKIFVARKERVADVGARVGEVALVEIALVNGFGQPTGYQIALSWIKLT